MQVAAGKLASKPSKTQVDHAVAALTAAFGNRVVTSQAVREQHGNTLTWVPNQPPDAVVFPQSTDDVQTIVRIVEAASYHEAFLVSAAARYGKTDVDNNGGNVGAFGLLGDGRTLLRYLFPNENHTRTFGVDNNLQYTFDAGRVQHVVLAGVDEEPGRCPAPQFPLAHSAAA